MKRREFLARSATAAAGQVLAASLRRSGEANAAGLGKADTTLRIQPMTLELAHNIAVKTVGYNGQAPGPVLRFQEGQQVNIDVFNETDVEELVHWHGLAIDPFNDGAMEEGSPMIPARGHQRYSFRPHPSGSRWYHTHTGAAADLSRATYTGQYGFLYIEPKNEPGAYDQEIFLTIHHWQPSLVMMGAPMKAMDVGYKFATFNDKLSTAAEPIRVRPGERVLFHFLNASATEAVRLALPGHVFTVIALDGNAVPQPRAIETLELAVAERVDAIVEMNLPGVWLLGAVDAAERGMGLGRTIEYAGQSGSPIWQDPDTLTWNYFRFANEAAAPAPDFRISMVFAALAADANGMQHWTINGQEYPQKEPLYFQKGKRHRLSFVNGSAEPHPLHLHRHSFELVSLGSQRGSGLMKDTINIPANSTMEVDVVANNPGDSLFHCHQQLHMDYGFMQLFRYA